MSERVVITGASGTPLIRILVQLAFGTHPGISRDDDDGMVTNAVANNTTADADTTPDAI